ncbi:hypothetical protein MTO96_047291 [Rhipicephalus appendiculatus]
MIREDPLKFIQVEVQCREQIRMSRERPSSGRSLANRKATDISTQPHLPSAVAVAARSASGGISSRPGQTMCPLCGFPGHMTRDCLATLSEDEKCGRLWREDIYWDETLAPDVEDLRKKTASEIPVLSAFHLTSH